MNDDGIIHRCQHVKQPTKKDADACAKERKLFVLDILDDDGNLLRRERRCENHMPKRLGTNCTHSLAPSGRCSYCGATVAP